jgi:tripartite-type tricarboxylate transporter receptor subunit TctC
MFGQWLSERLGQQFIVENRAGAGGTLGTAAVVRSAADGYTLLLLSTVEVINATLYDKAGFDFARDIIPVAGLARSPLFMVMNPAVPAQTIPEFIAYAKSNPRKMNMSSAGNGSPQHVYGELFKLQAGVDMLHVPYRGSAPALADLISGQVHVMFEPPTSSLPYIRSGQLRAMAVTGPTRWQGMSNLPAVAEFVPGFTADVFGGIGAPRGTPQAVIQKLNGEISAALASQKFKTWLADTNRDPLAMSPEEFGRYVRGEIEKCARVIKAANIKAE